MRRILVGLLVGLGALFGLFGLSTSASAAPINPDYLQAVLPSGHCLIAQRSFPDVELISPSGRIELWLDWNGQLNLENEVKVKGLGGAGVQTWFAAYSHRGTKQSTLCMQRNGDLVLRRDGHVAWRTHTAGRAVNGSARVLSSGALVVRTTHGKRVWSSHTTAMFLVAGDHLMPGQTLVNRTYPHSWTTLQMRRSGDLVLLRNHQVVWRTHTHIRGSYLLVTQTGRIDLLNPHHQVIWRSRAVGHYPVFSVAQGGRITLLNLKNKHCWQRPAHSTVDCLYG